jgi:hypothetical protein
MAVVTAKKPRAEVLERFVMLDALVKVVDNLTDSCLEDAVPLPRPRSAEPTPWGTRVSWDAVSSRLGQAEHDVLWDEAGIFGDPEWTEAQRKAELLAADLLERLAANPVWCIQRALLLRDAAGKEA